MEQRRNALTSSDAFPTRENPGATLPGIEPGSPRCGWGWGGERWRRLDCSPSTIANRVQSPAGSRPDFRTWESCWTMPLVGGFSRGSPVSSVLAFQRCSILTSFRLSWLSRPRTPEFCEKISRSVALHNAIAQIHFRDWMVSVLRVLDLRAPITDVQYRNNLILIGQPSRKISPHKDTPPIRKGKLLVGHASRVVYSVVGFPSAKMRIDKPACTPRTREAGCKYRSTTGAVSGVAWADSIVVLRADEGEANVGTQGWKGRRGKNPADLRHRPRRFPHAKIRGVNRPVIEPVSPWWEASCLTVLPPRPQCGGLSGLGECGKGTDPPRITRKKRLSVRYTRMRITYARVKASWARFSTERDPSPGEQFMPLQTTVAERLARSPPTKANRVEFLAGSPDFCKWESC
ncbi:hypothetical protein PR048_032264 [Dryococelus australis]|uniref:Ribosomal protein L2 n=1 Tax=Dryococelus australis TaxID=614101 RepID=A0ABQ9G1R1_9NEOP|nr:hypothetical protein PR048_032264 [Dryococelus australis]